MPNRMLKDSVLTSRNIGKLSDFQFRLWTYLILYVDDFGRAPADPELIRGQVFTRRKGVTETQIANGIKDLASAGMIGIYIVDGESYLHFPNWAEHQRIQTKRSKYPAPPEDTESHGESRKITVSHGESPLETETEIETEIETETKTKPKSAWVRVCAEDAELADALKAFDEMRRKMKKPLTDRARDGIIASLEKYPRRDWVKLIDQSITKGWLSIYPIDGEKGTAQPDPYASYDIKAAEEEMRRTVPTLKKKEAI